MLCPHCGKNVQDGTVTCPYCGASLQQNPRPEGATPLYTQPPVADPAPEGGAAEPPVIRLIRRMVRSPQFLVPAIGYTCMVVLSLMVTLQSASPAAMEMYLAPLATDAQLASLADTLSTVVTASAGGALVGQIPSILVAVGIWMMYAAAAGEPGKPLKTTGLTIIRVIQIISLVLICLVALLMLVIFGIALAAISQVDDAGAAVAVLAVVLVLVAVIIVLEIIYYVKLMGMVNNFRWTIRTGAPMGNVSTYVAVLTIVGGVISLGTFLTGNVFSGLAGVASAVSGIGFGIFLFRYRDEVRKIAPPAQAWNAQ